MTITAIVAALLAIVYRYVCMWENKRRDKNCAEAYDHAYEDDLTDRKVCIDRQGAEGVMLIVLAEPTVPLPAVVTACTASRKMELGGRGASTQRCSSSSS